MDGERERQNIPTRVREYAPKLSEHRQVVIMHISSCLPSTFIHLFRRSFFFSFSFFAPLINHRHHCRTSKCHFESFLQIWFFLVIRHEYLSTTESARSSFEIKHFVERLITEIV